MTKTLNIKGMSCGHCVRRVENALNEIDGVNAKVNLSTNSADVTLTKAVTDQQLITAVEEAGYEVASIK